MTRRGLSDKVFEYLLAGISYSSHRGVGSTGVVEEAATVGD